MHLLKTMASSVVAKNPKLILIIGVTGSGKSKLAIELAKHFNGEIINADVIQMYKGLDTLSAKVPVHERESIPHHMMSFLPPEFNFNVKEFQTMAKNIVAKIHEKNKIPIVVGGTLYYTQSLLKQSSSLLNEFEYDVEMMKKDEIDGEDDLKKKENELERNVSSIEHIITQITDETSSLSKYDLLKKVDPVMATRLHPNDTRKIERALQVFTNTGVPYSKMLELQAERVQSKTMDEQENEEKESMLTICLTVNDKSIHNCRLDQRVENMKKENIIREIMDLDQYLKKLSTKNENEAIDLSSLEDLSTVTEETNAEFEKVLAQQEQEACELQKVDKVIEFTPSTVNAGLLQAIGFKEFSAFLALRSQIPPEQDKNQEPHKTWLEDAYKQGIESVKIATHRYARKQIRWIRNRFLSRNVPLYLLDTSDISAWNDAVVQPTVSYVQDWIDGKIQTENPKEENDVNRIYAWEKSTCPDCNVVLNGTKEKEDHFKSKKHSSTLQWIKRRAMLRERGIEIDSEKEKKRKVGKKQA
jgi:tRNA dimethylallyltransferase